MNKKKGRAGHGEIEYYVRLPRPMLDSAAFKTLFPDAVWLYVQLLRQFKAPEGYSWIILPFGDAA